MKKKSILIVGSIALVALLVAGYFYVDSILFDGVKPRQVQENGFQASFYAKANAQNQPAVVLLGGGEWGAYWGQELSRANYAGLSLPYSGQEGLPMLLEEIPLEYFQDAIEWLREQPEVNPKHIVVMGASRNAELALVLASYYPELVHGVIAYCPSSVSWSNTVHAFNSDSILPTWTLDNQGVPYIPMAKLKPGASDTLETLSYWTRALRDSASVAEAAIRVEQINGPILLLSGRDDEVWPAAMMADMIAARAERRSFTFELENVQYEAAGHLISGNPNFLNTFRYGEMVIEGQPYAYGFGGTPEGDQAAQQDATQRIFDFLAKMRDG